MSAPPSPLTQVPVSPISPERFRPLLGDSYSAIEDAVITAGRVLRGRVVWHINSTARGGGVAEMLQSLLAYARGAGVDVRWLTIGGDPEFFRITKRLHNRLHESPGDGGELGEPERAAYERSLAAAGEALRSLVGPGDIVYLHDPQPAALARMLNDDGVACVWRCHVGIDAPDELARTAWDFLRPYVSLADAYVFSRPQFFWEGLDREKLWIVPPSIDAFSPKNAELGADAVDAILAAAGLGEADGRGVDPAFTRRDGSSGRVGRAAEVDQDRPVPRGATLIAQVSRWDRLKDPVGVVRCFRDHVSDPDAHLLLAGPSTDGVADDPEGAEVLAEVKRERLELPEEIRARTHVASLPMDDVDENAAIVNAIQRRADIVLQKSLAEGFGLTVAEAMWKGRPVVAGRVGGIQDQIVDGESGILVDDPADLAAVGAALDSLLADSAEAARIGEAARERVLAQFLGSRHLVQYMELLEGLLEARDGS